MVSMGLKQYQISSTDVFFLTTSSSSSSKTLLATRSPFPLPPPGICLFFTATTYTLERKHRSGFDNLERLGGEGVF